MTIEYNPFPVSFSKLSSYKSCAKKFFHLSVVKDVVEEKHDAADMGVRAHEAIEHFLRDGILIPPEFQKFEMMVKFTTRKLKGEFKYEQQLAIKRDYSPSEWTDPACWYRGIVDLVCIHENNTATIIDWKTGKPKEDETQLRLFSGLVFANFPSVTEVVTQYVWLAYNTVTTKKYSREDQLWDWVTSASEDLSSEKIWGASPSGLCKNYCPIVECEHNGKKTRIA